VTCLCKTLQVLATAWFLMIAYAFATDTALIEPHNLIVDRSCREHRSTPKSSLAGVTTLSGIPGMKH
jgi:hypothetical protein